MSQINDDDDKVRLWLCVLKRQKILFFPSRYVFSRYSYFSARATQQWKDPPFYLDPANTFSILVWSQSLLKKAFLTTTPPSFWTPIFHLPSDTYTQTQYKYTHTVYSHPCGPTSNPLGWSDWHNPSYADSQWASVKQRDRQLSSIPHADRGREGGCYCCNMAHV